MTRLTRIIIGVVLLELMAIAVGVPLARWPTISASLSGDGPMHRLDTIRLVITAASPLVLVAAWMIFERRLGSPSLRLSPLHRGYAEAGLLTVGFFLMAYQGWYACQLGQGVSGHASRELMLRGGAILAGMVMAIQGNFSAKTPAPEGVRAPDPVTWTRLKLRSGWILTLTGLALAICAIALPLTQLLPVFLLLGGAAIAYVVVQKRKLS